MFHTQEYLPDLPEFVSASPYVTRIEITGFGGVLMLGRLHEDVAAYWSSQDKKETGEHIFFVDKSVEEALDGKIINPDRAIDERLEADNIGSVNGPEIHEGLQINAFSSANEQIIQFTHEEKNGFWRVNREDNHTFYDLDVDAPYLVSRTFEETTSFFYLEGEAPFDSKLLEMNVVYCGASCVIDSICYAGVDLKPTHRVGMMVDRPIAYVLSN